MKLWRQQQLKLQMCVHIPSTCVGPHEGAVLQASAQASTRLVEAILTGIEDATIGTIISWLELREKLPSRESLASLVVLIAHALSGMRSGLRSALCAGWTHLGARR